MITETGGGSAVYEGGCFATSVTVPPAPATCRCRRSTRTPSTSPRRRPALGGQTARLRHRLGRRTRRVGAPSLLRSAVPGRPAAGHGRRHVPVSTTGRCRIGGGLLPPDQLNGDPRTCQKRSIVLAFNAADCDGRAQTVYMYAVDDARAEGTRIVTASHSVIQTNCDPNEPRNCYDGAIVRNVEVTVYDNDQPDVLVTQLDPNIAASRTTATVVLEGWGTVDARRPATRSPSSSTATRSCSRARRPATSGSTSCSATCRPTRPRVCLTSSDALGRFSSSRRVRRPDQLPADRRHVPRHVRRRRTGSCRSRSTSTRATTSRREDPHNTTITHTVDTTLTDRRGVPRTSAAPKIRRAPRRPRARRREPGRVRARERRQDARHRVRSGDPCVDAGRRRRLPAPPQRASRPRR